MDRIEQLIEDLQSEDARVRLDAAVALGGLGDPQAIGPLKTALRDQNDSVRDQALAALYKLGGAPSNSLSFETGIPQRVVLVNLEMPFWDLVMLMVKVALASIPATILLYLIFAILSVLLGSLSGR